MREDIDCFIPDGASFEEALGRTTHLVVMAHQDDIEANALSPVFECYDSPDAWLTGIICSDSPETARVGQYAAMSQEERLECRHAEQRQAALVGRYGAVLQLAYPSEVLKSSLSNDLVGDLVAIMKFANATNVYTHNLADKHPTHIGVAAATVAALRKLPQEDRPTKLLGMEGWRNLDWLLDSEKVVLDASGYDHLAGALMGLYDTQIRRGKRFDKAVIGRKQANASFIESVDADAQEMSEIALDMTPLLLEDTLSPRKLIQQHIKSFAEDVERLLGRHFPD